MTYKSDTENDYQMPGFPLESMAERGKVTLRTTDPPMEITIREALVSVTGNNGIVKTALTGVKGTVKEFTDRGDFTVQISGAFTGEYPGDYPETDTEKLLAILAAQESVAVESKHLAMFGVYNLAITSYIVNQDKGFTNRQAVTINAVSDTPFEIEYNDEKDSF